MGERSQFFDIMLVNTIDHRVRLLRRPRFGPNLLVEFRKGVALELERLDVKVFTGHGAIRPFLTLFCHGVLFLL